MEFRDIPTAPVLQFLAYCATADFQNCGNWGTWLTHPEGAYFENSVQHAMPADVPWRLAKKKMNSLIRRGLVDGCPCGCRGDYELTEKGRAFLAEAETLPPHVRLQ